MDDSHVTDESFQEFDSIEGISDNECSHLEIKNHICCYDNCNKSFARLSRLIQHERVHSGERPFTCSEENCDKSYTRLEHLKRHVARTHKLERTPADVVTCEFKGCYKTFISKDNLKRHKAEAHETILKKYPCVVDGCNKIFAKRFQLRYHIYEHKGVEPFQCHIGVCKRRFKQKSHLMRHLKSHEGYKCDVGDCKLVFEKWSQLRNHKAHQHKTTQKRVLEETSDQERFVCQYEGCQRSYAKYGNLKHHVDVCHTKSKLFKCEECEKTFASQQKLQSHAKMHDTRTVKKNKTPPKNELQLSDICESFRHLNDPFVALERISLPVVPKLLSEEHQIAERLRRMKRRIKKNLS